jgi:hypothetical protein
MAELVSVSEWLYSVLASNQAGVADRIYGGIAPNSATMPYIVYQYQDGGDVSGANSATRIMGNGRWLVRVIGKTTSSVALETIYDTMHGLLHGQSGTGVLGCVKEEPFEMVEVIDDVQYRHLGAIYRIYAE